MGESHREGEPRGGSCLAALTALQKDVWLRWGWGRRAAMQRDVPAGTGSDPCWWWRCLATSRRCPQDTKLSHAWSPLALVAVRPISFVIWANGSGVPALAALSGAAAPRARLVHGFLGCSRECVLGCCILVHAPKQQENPLVVTHYCKHLPLANSLKFGGVSSSFPWLRCHARGPRAGSEPPSLFCLTATSPKRW